MAFCVTVQRVTSVKNAKSIPLIVFQTPVSTEELAKMVLPVTNAPASLDLLAHDVTLMLTSAPPTLALVLVRKNVTI